MPSILVVDDEPTIIDLAALYLEAEGFAVRRAAEWRAGLAGWGLGPANIQRLRDSVEWSIYTPGSDAGIPVSVLSSLGAPDMAWEGNREILRERISSTVTSRTLTYWKKSMIFGSPRQSCSSMKGTQRRE